MKRLALLLPFFLFYSLSFAQSGNNCSSAIGLNADTICNAQSFSTTGAKWFSFSPSEEHVSIYLENDHECGTNTPHIHCLDAFGGTCSGLDTLATDELPQFDGAKELDIDLSGLDTSKTYYIKATPETRFRECPRGECPDVGSADLSICVKERTIRFLTASHPQGIHQEEPGDDHAYVTNEGQVEDTDGDRRLDIKAYSRNSSPKVYIGDTLNSFVFSRIDTSVNGQDTLRRIDMNFPNSNGGEVFRTERMETHFNFYRPGVIRGVPGEEGFKRVVKDEIYDGIDLHYSSNRSGLKMYFVVEPGVDPSKITMDFDNPGSTSITGNGGLRLETSLGEIAFERAHVYRINPAGNIVPMPPSGDFVQKNGNEYGIEVGNYPDFMPLVIQIDRNHPESKRSGTENLEWSSYFGGPGYDIIYKTKSTRNGLTYFTGFTTSSNFPNSNSCQGDCGSGDILIGKLFPDEDIHWITKWGGQNLDGLYAGQRNGLAANPPLNNHVYITSTSYSKSSTISLPTQSGAYNYTSTTNCPQSNCSNALIGKINVVTGNLVWGTFFGGDGFDKSWTCAVDKNNNLWVAGATSSGLEDYMDPSGSSYFTNSGGGFVAAFDKNLNLIYSSEFKGLPKNISVWNATNFVLTGRTSNQSNFPQKPSPATQVPYTQTYGGGGRDGFITLFNSNFEIEWSTYIGGSGKETGMDIAVNQKNDVILTGNTKSSDFNTKQLSSNPNAYFQTMYQGSTGDMVNKPSQEGDGFISIFSGGNSNEFKLLTSTYFGGVSDEIGISVATDWDNNIYLFGPSFSETNFPFPNSSPTNFYEDISHADGDGNGSDCYIAAFDESFNHIWTTYFGGKNQNATNPLDFGTSISIDKPRGELYISGNTNSKNTNNSSTTFPLANLSGSFYDNNFAPSFDGFISRFSLDPISTNINRNKVNKSKVYSLFTLNKNVYNLMISKKMKAKGLYLYNSLGELIEVYSKSKNHYKIDLKSHKIGVYILKIVGTKQIYVEKIGRK